MILEKPIEIDKGIYQLRGKKPSSHVYLIKSRSKNVLVDSGLDAHFKTVRGLLEQLGLCPEDVHLVINTHEHFDHIGANHHFADQAVISAHRLAASKIEKQDEYVTMYRRCLDCLLKEDCDRSDNIQEVGSKLIPNLWLDERTSFDLHDFHLQIIHTPGHTSGCICIYEPNRRILFSGDTIFAFGTLPLITPSGSAGDYLNSLHLLSTRKIDLVLPGHGRISDKPDRDLAVAIDFAKSKLKQARSLGGTDTWTESTPLKAFLSDNFSPIRKEA